MIHTSEKYMQGKTHAHTSKLTGSSLGQTWVHPSLIARHMNNRKEPDTSTPPSFLSYALPSLLPVCQRRPRLEVCNAPISLIIRVEGSITLQQQQKQLFKCPLLPHTAFPYGVSACLCVYVDAFCLLNASLGVRRRVSLFKLVCLCIKI